MFKRYGLTLTLVLGVAVLLVWSINSNNEDKITGVGMLVENTVNDQTWGNKGYQGLMNIEDEFDTDVYYKEKIQTQQQVNQAVEEFSSKGVNVIFGHSSIYGNMFKKINRSYPNIHFVYFNGGYYDDNITSLHFSSHAMGFFGGMVAGKMTETDQVGLIASYEWQPEIEGFYEGVKFENPDAKLNMEFVNNWDDTERAMKLLDQLDENQVDVFYPAGDSFSVPIIKEISQLNKYAIGFVTDQLNIAEDTVLTSTVQHVDRLYLLAAKKFNQDELKGGVHTFDFQDDVISMGSFGPKVPNYYKQYILDQVKRYKREGLLPNEK
ncbi:BMP family ABC transporter substrate-binding protein [Aquibacillus sediminis]|uniref:BMP family ABC transporter substrate-binding protein n=1 Tax=Aquibacillus sediminis TaxID=2574734 RepID=UPI001FE5C3F0|nr:BMP family ABC transporter substrate-binding protein [Aquibacillus sediminis]